jgi:hypothetical protein
VPQDSEVIEEGYGRCSVKELKSEGEAVAEMRVVMP